MRNLQLGQREGYEDLPRGRAPIGQTDDAMGAAALYAMKDCGLSTRRVAHQRSHQEDLGGTSTRFARTTRAEAPPISPESWGSITGSSLQRCEMRAGECSPQKSSPAKRASAYVYAGARSCKRTPR
jgi:hypothetical protein